MDRETAMAAIAADGRRLIEAAAEVDAPVPTCPDWTVHDLLAHIGWVHRFVREHVVRNAPERLSPEIVESGPAGEAVRAWAADGLESLLESFSTVDMDAPCTTWGETQKTGFFVRRMVHETAIHRVDSESSSGEPAGIDDGQGADGVDELYSEVLAYAVRRWPRPLPAGSLHLHRTDGGEGEWTLRAEGGRIVLSRGHEKGDAALRGGAGDLFLAVWGRLPLDRLELFGDEAVAREWLDLTP